MRDVKLLSKKGETIIEALAATLVGSLGSIMFAQMAMTSVKVFRIGVERLAEYADAEELIETHSESLGNSFFSISEGSNQYRLTESGEYTISIYGDEEKGIYAYAK